MAERMERRITDSASLTKMNTMLTSGRLSGNVRFLHLNQKVDEKKKCKLLAVMMQTKAISEKSTHSWKNALKDTAPKNRVLLKLRQMVQPEKTHTAVENLPVSTDKDLIRKRNTLRTW